MTRSFAILGITLFAVVCATGLPAVVKAVPADEAEPAPAFTHHAPSAWINSEPLSWQDLRGKVVLLDFWTFMCWNCYRSFPWLTSLEAALADAPFTVVGVHTPEFEAEKERAKVVERAAHFDLHHPIMMDNDHSYWNAIGNRYWPAYYLVDKRGRLRYLFIGETHAGTPQARRIEEAIRELLAEPAPEAG